MSVPEGNSLMRGDKGTVTLSVCFVALCIIGVMFLWQGILSAITLNQAKSWPAAQGTITTCKLDRCSNKGRDVTSKAVIEYAYQVGGKPYENDKLCFDQGGLHSYEAHEAIVEKLKDVKQIDVYYNPANPQQAAISRETSGDMFLTLVIAMICLSLAFGLALLTWPASKMDKVMLKNLKVYQSQQRE